MSSHDGFVHFICLVVATLHLAVLPQVAAQDKTCAASGQPGAPLIGVVTIPSVASPGSDYVPASYVRWIGAAGGRAVPIPSGVMWNESAANYVTTPVKAWSNSKLEAVFRGVNGILLPGGDPWPQVSSPVVRTLHALALEANRQGDYFPFWGTCAGFETLAVLAAQTCQDNVRDGNIPTGPCSSAGPIARGFDAENASWPLKLTPAAVQSRLLGGPASARVRKLLTDKPLAFHNHAGGIDVSTFHAQTELQRKYRILSTNVDRNGRDFVSTMEGIDVPFYGVQWHPEKTLYEWGISSLTNRPHEDINHGPEAVEATRFFADVFVAEARRNNHTLCATEAQALSYFSYSLAAANENAHRPEFIQSYHIDWKNSARDGLSSPMWL